MSDFLIVIVLGVAFALVFVILLSQAGVSRGEYHVAGVGDVYCPTCDGECREMEVPQAALSDFDND